MITFFRAPTRSPRARRGAVAATVVATLALVLGLFAAVTPSAMAGPVDDGWLATGPGTVTTVSDGSLAAAAMTYNGDGLGAASWEFTTVATAESAAGPIKVPWTWEGLHAWFLVTATLELVVNDTVVGTPVAAGPTSCCTTPSNGFLYGGIATFDVQEGDTYGFRLSGSNSDFNNFLRGTFTLSNKPYLDKTIGTDNRQWLGAEELPTEETNRRLMEAGEARWFRVPVVPGQQVTVELTGLPRDYDLALYGDIEAAFERLSDDSDLTQLAAASAAGAPGDTTPVPTYPESIQTAATSIDTLPSTQFAPRIYAPRIYAPRIYAPRIYAPRIYAPRIYAPRIYAPDTYTPDFDADPRFRDAFSAAQNQTLLAVSANTATQAETVSASTGNTDGFFYIRVQGHDDQVFDAANAFQVSATVTGGEACIGLSEREDLPSLAPTTQGASTVIVTDTNALSLGTGSQLYADYLGALDDLAAATDGVVVDVRQSERVQALQTQVDARPGCPYAMNLVAREVKDIVDSYRNADSKYVVIAGGDEIIPFFRYPDTSGLGQESQFVVPVLEDSPANASLANDQVLSQDAYGARTEVTIGGATVPVADLAVGRLVKTPDEIIATVEHFLVPGNETLPTPTSSLVTGYDFLEDAANRVNDEFSAATPGGRHDTLIEESGTPHDESWTADDLRAALVEGERHDLVYLAGHFSANDALAADFETSMEASELDPVDENGDPTSVAGHLTDTLVLSAGCHSGYNIVDGAAVPVVTNTYDWTQAMARQQALLIGGTGYQYGDTDFLEYSERLYLGIAKRLREGPAGVDSPPVPVGKALTLAKQDYLATLTSLPGIDQKAVLQATLYGLPMTGFDAPGRAPLGTEASQVDPEGVVSEPGQTLGLAIDDLDVATPTTRGNKPSLAGAAFPAQHSWRNGLDGVTVQPGAPALPKQVENVTVPGQVLRGVGFRGGVYTDTPNLLPLTGAPAIEGSTANTTFESPTFFPQRLAAANYFGALGDSGRTSLILTPAQYRDDPSTTIDTRTNIERVFSSMNVRLFYSGPTFPAFNGNHPGLAAPPSLSAVSGVVTDRSVQFSVRASGDPSAGVQQVWITWTGSGSDAGHGRWQSVDLTQVENDSTRWTGQLTLPPGQSSQGLRFVVQAANGVGAVGLDTADGDGYSLVQAPPAPGSPAAPTITGVTLGTGQALGQATVAFNPGDPGSIAPTYTVTATPTTAGADITSPASSGSPITVTGLTPGLSYRFTVTATNPLGAATSDAFGPVAIPIPPKADLALTVTAPATANKGATYTYTVKVTNNGPTAAKRVTTTLLLPGGVTYQSATGSPLRIGPLLTWQVANLASGASSTYTVTVKASAKGSQLAVGGTASLDTPDPKAANNLATALTTVK